MKKFILVLLLGLSASLVFGQRDNQKWYLNGIGGRLEVGADSDNLMGLNYGHFFRPKFAMEAMFISNWDFTSGTIYEGAVLAKYVTPFPNISSRLRWYAGGGWELMGQGIKEFDGETKSGDVRILSGPTAVLGIGYNIPVIPVNVCVEWRPTIYLIHKNRSVNDVPEKFAIFAFTLSYITRDKYKN